MKVSASVVARTLFSQTRLPFVVQLIQQNLIEKIQHHFVLSCHTPLGPLPHINAKAAKTPASTLRVQAWRRPWNRSHDQGGWKSLESMEDPVGEGKGKGKGKEWLHRTFTSINLVLPGGEKNQMV